MRFCFHRNCSARYGGFLWDELQFFFMLVWLN